MKYVIDLPEEIAKASEEYWKKSTGMVLAPYTEQDRKVIEDEVKKNLYNTICEKIRREIFEKEV